MNMSSNKKSGTVENSAKSTASSKVDHVASAPVGVKRSAEVVNEEVDEGPEDWSPILRKVFVTRGTGILKDTIANGDNSRVFTILGHFADDKIVVVQVWGIHAERVACFFKNAADASADGEVVWRMPDANQFGYSFRMKSDAGRFLRKMYAADFSYNLTEIQGKTTTPDLTSERFPQLYIWTSEPCVLHKNSSLQRLVPHPSVWGKTQVQYNDVPTTCTFQQASPKKSARVESASDVHQMGKSSRPVPTDLVFED